MALSQAKDASADFWTICVLQSFSNKLWSLSCLFYPQMCSQSKSSRIGYC